MSVSFRTGSAYVWSPSTTVGKLFVAQAHAIAGQSGFDSGISEIVEDEIEIDATAFTRFTAELIRTHDNASHPILRELLHGFAGTATALALRLNGELPPGASSWRTTATTLERNMPR